MSLYEALCEDINDQINSGAGSELDLTNLFGTGEVAVCEVTRSGDPGDWEFVLSLHDGSQAKFVLALYRRI